MTAKMKITWNDIVAKRAAKEGQEDNLVGAAEMILEASNMIVPLERGELMGSGTVDFDFDAGVASVYYDTVYAAKLHQNPQYNFQNGRRGKFLQAATRQSATRVMELYAAGFRIKFGKGSRISA